MVHLNRDKPLAASFARQLDEAQHRLVSAWSLEAPDAAFAEWATAVTGTPLALPDYESSIPTLTTQRWTEAPVLSAFGFRFAMATDTTWAQRWLEGFERLMGRDPAPADRNSFLFRPVELLGLALGAAAARPQDETPQRWLRETMERHATRLSASTVCPAVLVAVAASRVEAALSTSQLVPATQLDLAAMLWLHLVDSALAGSLCPVELSNLHRDLLTESAQHEPPLAGMAEQSVYAIALRHAVLGAVGDLDLHMSDPVQFVVTLCRRFPLLVRELGRRHNQREPFEVKDEYDVQDLLRGVLRLHFSDVRREEWNPSHGGVQSRSDLLLKPEGIVIESKMTRVGLGQRELVAQLIVDKEQYQRHPDCATLVCFAYDPDHRLPNPGAVEVDLSGISGNLRTVVVVSPQDA